MQKRILIIFLLLTLNVPLHPQVRFAVIPVEFPDCKFTCPTDSLAALCRKCEDYFNTSLHSQQSFRFILLDKYTSKTEHSVYGANGSGSRDTRFSELAYAACLEEDKSGDFSKIDHILFITAGKNEAEGADSEWFWPCQEQFPSNMVPTLDGCQFKNYAKACELDSAGTFAGHGLMCHEAGHLLGLPDLYDTDGERSGGIGTATFGYLSLMDRGDKVAGGRRPPLINAIEMDCLGYGQVVTNPKGDITLAPYESNGSFLKINGDIDGQYRLIENRSGSVLAVYSLDRSDNAAGGSDYYKKTLTARQRWTLNEVNCNPEHQCAFAEISPVSIKEGPKYIDLGGNIGIRNIRTGSDSSITMSVISPIVTDCVTSFQESISVIWHSEISKSELKSCTLYINGVTIADSDGTFIADKLQPGKSYDLSIVLNTVNDETYTYRFQVNTTPSYSGAMPFIYLNGAQRNSDGSFKAGQTLKLSIFNKPQHTSVKWYFDGIMLEDNPTLELSQDGDLNAILESSDGNRKVINKKIRVQ